MNGGGAPVDEERLRSLLSVDVGSPSPGAAGRSDGAVVLPDEPEADTGTRGRSLPWIALAGLVLAGMVLTVTGVNTIRSSTEGQIFRPVSDPAAPGYEALVEPTPTMLVIHTAGGLAGVTVLSLAGPGGGGVIIVPPQLVGDLPEMGLLPIAFALLLDSPAALAEVVGDALGAGIAEYTVVDDDRWTGLVEPVAPLSLLNPNELETPGGSVFPAGPIQLQADQVGEYLAAVDEGESDLARLYRHRLVWEAWLDAVAAAGTADAVPGELESGIGYFVRSLGAGPVRIETLPVRPTQSADFGDGFTVERIATDSLIAELIPFPRSPRPGVRPRLRVLDGTGTPGLAVRVAAELVPVGTTVAVVGNAATFDVADTTVTYLEEAFRVRAQAVARALGVDSVEMDDRYGDGADITVTLGADHV